MAEADRLRLAGRSEADYAGYGYAPLLADDLAAVAAVAGDVAATASAASNSASAAADSAATATTQATAAATSRAQADAAVASVTVGSTNSLAYPEQIRNLVTATDVVDVMIYDTRLDSDGGAWTERCTGASWFNEPLNTATRGAKRAFPKVALFILRSGTTNTLSIYDALELDGASVPRLWRIWSASASGILDGTQRAVFAMQGRIFVASSLGLYALDLAADRATRWDGSGSRVWSGTLTVTGAYVGNLASAALNTTSATAVDARVMPGAGIDPITRLAVPTILAGLTNGFAVIHPDQRVSNIALNGGYTRVRFTPDNRIAAIGVIPSGIAEVGPIPYAAFNGNTAWRTHRIGSSAIGVTGGIILPDAALTGSTLVDLAEGAVAQGGRLALIAEDAGDVTASLVASIGSNFTSGWMPQGRTMLAALVDGATGAAAGTANLIANGDFAAGLTGWTTHDLGAGAVSAVSGGVLHLPRVDTNNIARAATTIPTIIGETYRVSYDQVAAVGTNLLVGTVLLAANIATYFGPIGSTVGRVTVQFVATSTTTHLLWACQINNATAQIDNISARIVAGGATGTGPASPLDVVGTLNRAAVGTGNDVVGWGGWSASNYLEQPYSVGLDFGTGDYAILAWFQTTDVGQFALVWRQDAAMAGPRFGIDMSGGLLRGIVPGTTVNSTAIFADGVWHQAVVLRRAGVVETWVDGVRQATGAVAGDLSNASAVLRVGNRPDNTNFAAGVSLALLRIAGYAPTPAQIERMFRDERVLFQPGVRAFLGGASNATVRRIARSRFSNRLAVSMSDGLAVMDGLQRVERHTTATLSPAMANNSVTPVAMESGLLLIGTTANAGVRRDAVIGMDRLPATQPTPAAPRVFRARGITTDATPLTIAPRIPIGERETVVVSALVVARVYGASDTQRLTYERRATYHRDAGGNVTLAGSVQTIGTDVETTGTADATLAIDTTAQTVAAQVTGIAATRLVWSVRYQIERTTHDTTYEEVV